MSAKSAAYARVIDGEAADFPLIGNEVAVNQSHHELRDSSVRNWCFTFLRNCLCYILKGFIRTLKSSLFLGRTLLLEAQNVIIRHEYREGGVECYVLLGQNVAQSL